MDVTRSMNALAEYTAMQWGLVTAAQAKEAEVDSVALARMTEAGLLIRVRRGVYQLTAAEEALHLAEKSAWLALHPTAPAWERPKLDVNGGVVSHRSAARLHDLGELVSRRIEITVPRRRTTRDPEVMLRQRALTDEEITIVDGLPVTSIERTVIDLLDDHADASHIGQILLQAHGRGALDLDAVGPRVSRFSRRYGIKGNNGHALVDHLLSAVTTEPTRNDLLAHLLREVTQGDGSIAHRFDLIYPKLRGTGVDVEDLQQRKRPEDRGRRPSS
jgi:hypothetical protein